MPIVTIGDKKNGRLKFIYTPIIFVICRWRQVTVSDASDLDPHTQLVAQTEQGVGHVVPIRAKTRRTGE
jgi:hypothetical protein